MIRELVYWDIRELVSPVTTQTTQTTQTTMEKLKSKIKTLAKTYHQEIIDIRRHLHAHPELSYQEYETSKYVQSILDKIGVKYESGIADTGVVALIEGKNPSKKVIALRADMDALPITEANDISYKSTNEGVMHACGHDVHTSSLLGVSKMLTELKDEFEGTIKCIFQPAEEKAPGGASIMIKEGVLENPTPKSVIGQHVHPPLEAGKVGFRSGLAMASADEIYLTVHGKGGHAAAPQFFIDPIIMTSHILVALQQIVSRRANPTIPSVLSFGKIASVGGVNNVIPNSVKIDGTFRTVDETWREEALQKITKMATHLAEGMDGSCEVDIVRGYPCLYNNEPLTHRNIQAAIEYLGAENVVEIPLRMGAEDFAYYTQKADCCFYRLGIRNEAKGITSNLHTPTFNVDEQAIETSIGLMTWLALNELNAS